MARVKAAVPELAKPLIRPSATFSLGEKEKEKSRRSAAESDSDVDFVADTTARGGALKMQTILDEYTQEYYVLRAERALKAADVQKAVEQHGAPEFLRSNNGSDHREARASGG